MRRLKISAISYLNTAPLMWSFEHGRVPGQTSNGAIGPELPADFEIAYTIPSQCAQALAEGTADIGIIPAIAYATIPDLVILPDAVIAAKGPVRSILLVSKTPLEQVKTVAVDSSSRTSVVLLDTLLRKFLGGKRQLISMSPNVDAMLEHCDAALLIGDPALQARHSHSQYHQYDLSELWTQFTGLPFVFAFWVIRMQALSEANPELDVADVFCNSRDLGLQPDSLEMIKRNWSPHLGIPPDEIQSYLTRNIFYFLDDDCRRGLELFYQYAHECGLIEQKPELRLLSSARCLAKQGK